MIPPVHLLRRRLKSGLLALGLTRVASWGAPAEIVFQDFFSQPAGNITNSVPWIDVEGNGWQTAGSASPLALDGSGHVYNSATGAGAIAGVPVIPIGPHGSMTASASMQLPAGSAEWIGIGFASSNLFLSAEGSGSGPWLQLQPIAAVRCRCSSLTTPSTRPPAPEPSAVE
jgi:hypothetical protein